MKKLLIALLAVATMGLSALNAANPSGPYEIHAYEIVTEPGGYEFIGNTQVTANDHGGPGQSTVVMLGFPHNAAPQAHIGSSYGHINREISLYNAANYKIGTMFVYDYHNITSGVFNPAYYSLTDNDPVFVQ